MTKALDKSYEMRQTLGFGLGTLVSKVQSSKFKDQSPKTQVPSLLLSTHFYFVSRTYPGTGSTCDVEQVCEAMLFKQARSRT